MYFQIKMSKYHTVYRNIISIVVIAMVTTSCTSNSGRFTALSTNSVRGLEHDGKNRENITSVKGRSCENRIYFTRAVAGVFLIFPWFMRSFDVAWGQKERKLEDATYKAIKNGKEKGVFDGDLLIDASVEEYTMIIPLIYGRLCTSVEGDVISSGTRTKGYLEKKEGL
jgi:hypothetical protein